MKRVPVKDPVSVMPLLSADVQARRAFDRKIAAMKAALEGMQRSVNMIGRSLTRTFTTWRESLERAGIDVEGLTGVRYEKPVIIDDPIPGLRDVKIDLTNNIEPHYAPAPRCRMSFEPIVFRVPVVPAVPPLAVREKIAATSARILAELGPGPGRDA